MVALRQQPLPQDRRATSATSRRRAGASASPPSAAISRRRLLTLNAEVDLAGPGGQAHDRRSIGSISATRGRTSRSPRRWATANIISRCGRVNSSPPVRASNTPGLRSAYDKIRIRRSIEYPVTGVAVALRRDGDTLADLRVAFTGTNPRPVLLEGTAALCGGAARRARVQGPRRPRPRPDHVDEDHVHARPLSPPRRRRAGAAAGGEAVRGLKLIGRLRFDVVGRCDGPAMHARHIVGLA